MHMSDILSISTKYEQQQNVLLQMFIEIILKPQKYSKDVKVQKKTETSHEH